MSNITALFLVSFLFAGCANPYPGYWKDDDKNTEPKPAPPIIKSETALARVDILALMRRYETHTVTEDELRTQVLEFIAADTTGWNDADIDNAITGVQHFTKTYQPGFISAPGNGGPALAETADITFTLFTLKNTASNTAGFALTCNDIRIGAVLAAVEEGAYNIEAPWPPFMEMFQSGLDDYTEQTIALYNAFTEEDIQRAVKKYDRLLQSDYDELPLLHSLADTRWSEGPPYNKALLSITSSNSNPLMGRDIVCLAQIMAYHQKPSAPFGEVTYNGVQVGGFRGGEYDERVFFDEMVFEWNGMKSEPRANFLPRVYQDQISALMFQVAAQAGKTWAPNGKSAGVTANNARKALNAFGYQEAAIVNYTDNFNISFLNGQFCQLIKPELQNGRPLYASALNAAADGENAEWVIDNCQVKTVHSPVYYPVEYVHCILGAGSYNAGWYMNGIFGAINEQPSPKYETKLIYRIY